MDYDSRCAVFARFFGFAGASLSVMLTAIGAAYATARSGSTIAMIGMKRPDLIMRSLLPVVLSGMISINGLIIGVIVSNKIAADRPYSLFESATHLGAGLITGFTGIITGLSIGMVGEYSLKVFVKQPRFFMGMVFILIFCEVLALYGLIIALIMSSSSSSFCKNLF